VTALAVGRKVQGDVVDALGIGVVGFMTSNTVGEQSGVGSAPVIAVAALTRDLQV
jgi:hypothetical protein